ncbi:MAG: PLP-dependent aminotransferase family protein [Alphaproteobacteria bacterium]|nr:PLP-dependent aminotransferase family protein [Alphaproteobacteria bacterium]
MPTTSRRRRRVLDLPIHLDGAIRNQGRQVHAALRAAIVDGLLAPGLTLPSSRDLAAQLGVRRNAIVAAYEHLASDGLIEARHGAGTTVAERLPEPTPPAPAAAPRLAHAPVRARPFLLGQTGTDARLLRRLGGLVRRRIAGATADELGYGDPRGSAHLRAQVAAYLAANRGVRCDPECIAIVSGTQAAIRLCADALLPPGSRVWMEDPGYYATQATLRAAGLRLAPVPVDDAGLDVAAGARRAAGAKAVYVTPSHQFPTGVILAMRRRIELLDWARDSGAWIFEDDYDSEFRYAGPPLTALAGLGSGRVIYIGTFTKTLFASLRLAYVVLPPDVVGRVVAARAAHDRFPARFLQDAVADLIADGTLAAHVRRMRARYREARDATAAALRESAGDALRFTVPEQGLHLLALLPEGVSRATALAIRDAAEVEVRLLSDTQLTPRGPEGFILGFSGFESAALAAAARRIGRAAREIAGGAAQRSPTARRRVRHPTVPLE